MDQQASDFIIIRLNYYSCLDQEQIEYKSYYVHETRAKYPNGGSLKVGCLYRIQGVKIGYGNTIQAY